MMMKTNNNNSKIKNIDHKKTCLGKQKEEEM
jgi:hypothetical protein